MNDLKQYWDIVKTKATEACAIVCVSTSDDGAVSLLAAGNDAAVDAGFDANKIIKEVAPMLGGRGGGKPKMAQAGGKDASNISGVFGAAEALL